MRASAFFMTSANESTEGIYVEITREFLKHSFLYSLRE